MAITPVKELVQQAKANIETMPIETAKEAIAAGTVMLVDIRDVRELDREGRIPGAFHAPRGMLEFWFDPASPYHKPALATDKKLVLSCAGAWRSALAVDMLARMGVSNIAELEGGFTGWREAGGAIEP